MNKMLSTSSRQPEDCRTARRIFLTMRLHILFFLLSVAGIINCSAGPLQAKPLRHLEKGDTLPSFTLQTLQSASEKITIVPAELNKPAVILFCTAFNKYHLEKDKAILSLLATLHEQYGSRVHVSIIYAEDRGGDDFRALVKSREYPFTFLHDPDLLLYNQYGVYITPVTIITDRAGKIIDVVPSTHNMQERIEGNLKVALDIWTADTFRLALDPDEETETTTAQKMGRRRLHYARQMMGTKMYPQAEREFAKALEFIPEEHAIYLELGQAQMAQHQWQKARFTFEKSIALANNTTAARAGQALAMYHLGLTDEALPKLNQAMAESPENHQIYAALGNIEETRNNLPAALDYYKKALAVLQNILTGFSPAEGRQ